MTIEETLEGKIKLRLQKSNAAKDILFFTGAGISAPDPCSFPLGRELHKMLLLYYTDMTSWEIEKFLNMGCISFEKTVSIILYEYGTLDNAHANLPINLLEEVFIYRDSDEYKKNNDYHKFFRKHIQKGGKHFTVNLDQFIELGDIGQIETLTPTNAINQHSYDNTGFLFKVHADPTIDSVGFQGFLYEVVERGLDSEVKKFLDRQLNSVKTVIFIGYGGVDKFDITPYFTNKDDGFFSNTSALWINYSKEKEITVKDISGEPDKKNILSKFGSWLSVECSPEVILNQLFDNTMPVIGSVERNNGYKKEYENFFRTNTLTELLTESGESNEQKITKYMLIKKKIREKLL